MFLTFPYRDSVRDCLSWQWLFSCQISIMERHTAPALFPQNTSPNDSRLERQGISAKETLPTLKPYSCNALMPFSQKQPCNVSVSVVVVQTCYVVTCCPHAGTVHPASAMVPPHPTYMFGAFGPQYLFNIKIQCLGVFSNFIPTVFAVEKGSAV